MLICWMGKKQSILLIYRKRGRKKRAILESYTKAYSAEYQAQALIDLAFEMRKSISDLESIREITIYTSHHTHYVIGTGSNDPQKQDPTASRETLDHSITYIFAVALEDGHWDHLSSYDPKRINKPRTIRLWHKIKTCEEEEWTKLYHHPDPRQKSFGGKVEIIFQDGSKITKQKTFTKRSSIWRKNHLRERTISKNLWS